MQVGLHPDKTSSCRSGISPIAPEPEETHPIDPQTEAHLQILRLIEGRPDLTQRQIAEELGISLGKTNYCLKALIAKGLVKAKNFSRNPDKVGYAYLLTPEGFREKVRITRDFIRRKQAEYEALEEEIRVLSEEVAGSGEGAPETE